MADQANAVTTEHQRLVAASTDGTGFPGSDHKRADRLLQLIVRRRRWAIHRHVHLVSALLAAQDVGPVSSVLSAGCGAGLSELFLAVTNPHIHFTLTDFDEERLDRAKKVGHKWKVDNVSYETLDLLTPATGRRFDFVSSIEVLEHIEDDTTAARNLLAYSGRFAYILVPFCNEVELDDPARRERVWRRNEHHRPGYTHATMSSILGRSDAIFRRNCYFMPAGQQCRLRLDEMSDEQVVDARVQLIDEIVGDVQSTLVEGGAWEAGGIEALVLVEGREPPP